MSKTKKFLAFFLSFILVLSTLSTTGAEAAIREKVTENPIIIEDLPITEDLIEVELPGLDDYLQALSIIEQIPESVVLEGTDSIINWYRENIDSYAILTAIEYTLETYNNP